MDGCAGTKCNGIRLLPPWYHLCRAPLGMQEDLEEISRLEAEDGEAARPTRTQSGVKERHAELRGKAPPVSLRYPY